MRKHVNIIVCLIILSLFNLPSCGRFDPLNNTSWYAVKASDVSFDNAYISISFYNGRIEGHDSCNRFSVEYEVNEPDTITINRYEFLSTLADCPESENTKTQRSLFFQALWEADFFDISENILTFYDSGQNEILVLNRRQVHLMNPADLVGTDWLLESLNDTPVPEGLDISLSFTSNSEASGRAGNYDYWLMEYEAKGDIIRWGIRTARNGELSDDLQSFALRYLDTIGAGTHQYNQTEDKLELFTQTGDTLIYLLVTDTN